MIIIKHGVLPEHDFACNVCGCEFTANIKEYEIEDWYACWQYKHTSFKSNCPDCGSQVIDIVDKQGVTKND